MQVGNAAEKIESSGLGEGNAFTIPASAKAFGVLSSNLYQNKILAVIREISCNAADAHSAAGLPLCDIKVHLPTYAEPYFSVRDYGSGLSHSDVLSLYTTYFLSTKDNDNSQIGGFGLGSKSPFAVADQFTVTSWHGGYKRTYVCYKDSGLPRINAVSEQQCPSTETGIEVQVAAHDWFSWEREAINFFKWWPELPTITGTHDLKIEPVEFAMDGYLVSPNKVDGLPEWAFLPNNYPSQVFIGLVPYTLNWKAIPNVPQEVSDLFSGASVFLRLPIGAVSISPSREALSYDPSTCATLLQKLREIVREYIKGFKASVDQQPTLYAARKFIYSQKNIGVSRVIMSMVTCGALTWKGQRLHLEVPLDASDFGDGITFDIVVNWERRPKSAQRYLQSGVHYYHSINNNEHVLWSATAPRNYTATLMHNFANEPGWRVLIIKGGTYADVCKVCLDKGLPEPIDYASLEAPPAAAPASRRGSAHAKTTGYVYSGLSYSRTISPIDLEGGGLYMEFVNGEPRHEFQRALDSLHACGFLGVNLNRRIIGLSKARLAKSPSLRAALGKHGWVCFNSKWVADNVPAASIEEHYKAGAVISWLNSNSTPQRTSFNAVTWKGGDDILKIVRPYLKRHYPYSMARYGAHPQLVVMLSEDQSKARERGQNVGYELADKWKDFLNLHPMLQHINFNTVPDAVLNDYINR